MMVTNRTKTAGLIALVVFLGSLIALGALVYFIEKRSEQLTEREAELARSRAHAEELIALARLVEESQEERDMMARYVLRDDQVIDFLSIIESMAREQGVALETKSLDVSPLGGAFEALQAAVSMEGEYGAVLHTLRLFETLPYQSRLEDVTLARTAESGTAGRWTMSFTVFVTKHVNTP